MPFRSPRLADLGGALRRHWRAISLIAAAVAVPGLLFAFAAGWLDPGRLTPAKIADALEAHDGLHPGFRRAHAKGICFVGRFDSNGQGARLSRAAVFGPRPSSVIGRFSTGGGQPYAADGRLVFHGMALSLSAPGGEQWRTTMDDTPIFNVATPQAFLEFQIATRPDRSGKPDPAKVSAFLAAHPETRAFIDWLRDHPLPSSFANGTYYSIDAFRFTDAAGKSRFVRWAFVPEAPFESLDKSRLASLDKNFLFDDLVARAARGPLRWHLVITLASAGDPVDNATVQWPEDREKVDAGTLAVDRVVAEDEGPCRDLNFDPLILPAGIGPSDDPLLAARSAVYSASFTRRAGEPAQPSAVALERGGAVRSVP
ncbi:MAG: catalase family peroxidase [Nevskia sp.]|nr:catalase family peroxidase [Nevskia sp.]